MHTGSIYFGHAGLRCPFYDSRQVRRYFLQLRSAFVFLSTSPAQSIRSLYKLRLLSLMLCYVYMRNVLFYESQ